MFEEFGFLVEHNFSPCHWPNTRGVLDLIVCRRETKGV